MNIEEAKAAIDKIIKKARVHLYKPIQVAEILHRDRIERDIDLSDLSIYRTPSRKWRDVICLRFLGRTSTSSARYQDDVFNKNAVPPEALVALGKGKIITFRFLLFIFSPLLRKIYPCVEKSNINDKEYQETF